METNKSEENKVRLSFITTTTSYYLYIYQCPAPTLGKSGKRICCSCPETKVLRDECVITNGEDKCADVIEAHKACLRKEGFKV